MYIFWPMKWRFSGLKTAVPAGFMLLLLAGQGCHSHRILTRAFDLRQDKIFIGSLEDNSGIAQAATFPRDSLRQKILLAMLDEMQRKFIREAQKYSSRGQYEVVSDSMSATAILTLCFRPFTLQENTLTAPCAVRVNKVREQKELVHDFTVTSRPLATGTLDNYHLWGELLGGFKRNFPFADLGELFYSAENASPAP
jgi:hypothetical protein